MMDFLDFENHDLYFDEAMSSEDDLLLKRAANEYPSKRTEEILLDLQARLPDNLTIIVALYRFYYYQHRYQDALDISARAMEISANMMGLDLHWQEISEQHLGEGVFVSMGLIRFYMLALKASAFILMRINETEQAHERLKKIIELDPGDQFGAEFLYKISERKMSLKHAERENVESLFNR